MIKAYICKEVSCDASKVCKIRLNAYYDTDGCNYMRAEIRNDRTNMLVVYQTKCVYKDTPYVLKRIETIMAKCTEEQAITTITTSSKWTVVEYRPFTEMVMEEEICTTIPKGIGVSSVRCDN